MKRKTFCFFQGLGSLLDISGRSDYMFNYSYKDASADIAALSSYGRSTWAKINNEK